MHWEEIYNRLAGDREDAQAWKALQQRVRAWARANLRGRGSDLVEDVVADVCASVAVAFDRAHGARTFHGFVLGHCLNVRRELLRRRRGALVSLEGVDVPAPEAEQDLFDQRDLEWLTGALHTLPDRERRAVGLRYFEQASGAQIAQALGVTEVNARRIVFNGLRHLRQQHLSAAKRSNSLVTVW
jgi:RNA polymerase sigma factor (sigma-70 family)